MAGARILAAIEQAQREFEPELEASDVKTSEADAGAARRDAGNQERQPEVLQGQGGHHPALVSAAADAWNGFAAERGLDPLWGELSESQQYLSTVGPSPKVVSPPPSRDVSAIADFTAQ